MPATYWRTLRDVSSQCDRLNDPFAFRCETRDKVQERDRESDRQTDREGGREGGREGEVERGVEERGRAMERE